MKTVLSVTAALLTVCGTAAAQDQRDEFQIIRFHRVHLRNGNVIDGNLLSLSDREAVMKLTAGDMTIKRGMIEKIEYIKMRSLLERPPVVETKPKDAEKKAADAPPSDNAKTREAFEPLPTPGGVPVELRDRADAIIAEWMKGRSSDRQLAKQFEDLGQDITLYLSALLEQRTKHVPVAAIAAAINRLGDSRGTPGLVVALRDGVEPEDRRQSLLALAKFATPDLDASIVAALGDPASTVWKEAKDILIERHRKGTFDDLADVVARNMLNAEDKIGYAITLGSLGSPAARKELLNLLGSGDDTGKRAAMQGLSLRPHPEDGAQIMLYLSGRDSMLKREACLFVGKAKYNAAVPDLILLLNDTDSGVVSNAHWALKEITSEKLGPDQGVWNSWFDASNLKKELGK
jgi:HEAT repeat protein